MRVFLPDEPDKDAPVVVCAELVNNPGMSVTNAVSRIAGEVISSFRLPIPVVWIEHYEDGARGTDDEPETFDLVVFEDYRPRKVLSADGWSVRIGSPAVRRHPTHLRCAASRRFPGERRLCPSGGPRAWRIGSPSGLSGASRPRSRPRCPRTPRAQRKGHRR